MEFRATHTVINVPELRYKIFAELPSFIDYQPDESQLNRLTLLAAATSCKTLSTAALDVLWADMCSLEPLLSFIGIHKIELLDGHSSYALTLPTLGVNSVQWAKMMCYAARIRHLRVEDDPFDNFIYFHLCTLLKGSPLLSKLKSLYFPWGPSLAILIPPTLKSLEIPPSDVELKYFPHFLGILHNLAPSLEHLNFDEYLPEWGSIYELLGQFKHLRRLRWSEARINNGVPSGIEALFSLPMVTEISLPLSGSNIKLVPAVSTFTSINLRTLHITCGSTVVIGDVLDHLRHIPLASLHIRYSDICMEKGYPLVVQTWASCLAHLSNWTASLRSLNLSDGSLPSNRNPSGITQEISLLKPLLDLHLLENFEFRGLINFDLSDGDFLLMAVAWPSLESLVLNNFNDVPSTQATFASLQSFATYCPKLQRISINLDIFALPESLIIGHHGLRVIALVSTCSAQPDEKIIQTSHYLDAVFPSLEYILGLKLGLEHPCRKVNEILKICQTARDDERARNTLG